MAEQSNTIVLISANAEWQAVREVLPEISPQASPFGEWFTHQTHVKPVVLIHGGWGKISAAASAQYVIDRWQPDLLVNLGTCGGFDGHVERGTVLLVDRTCVYDILEQMGDTEAALAHYATDIDLSWLPEPYPHPVLRGVLVSADRDLLAEDIPHLHERYGAVAVDWESGAIAWTAARNHVRCLILRAVSDLVGGNGGEAYGNIELFHARTREIMEQLIKQLPDWLVHIRAA